MLVKMEHKIQKNSIDKVYTYDEAIDLAGDGWYNVSLTLVLSMSLLAMCTDLFSFSVVVNLSSCDFALDLTEKSVLLSIPFIGPIVMAYTWGYLSDTRGRRFTMLIGMTISFLMSTLSAFSPHWIVLAVFRFIGTCCCSCAQSISYSLLGESCSNKTKGFYMLIMTSVAHAGLAFYMTISYLVGNMDFTYNWGMITFVPWRLLVLILALPLGISVLGLLFFYESPKYLLSAGDESQALDVLKSIYRRNGNNTGEYKIQKLVLNEEGNISRKDVPLLQSMKEQTLPLFKSPYLLRTLLLYYLVFVSYASTGSLYMWMPFLGRAFFAEGNSTTGNQSQGFCSILSQSTSLASSSENTCEGISLSMLAIALTSGAVNVTASAIMAKAPSRKKAMMIFILAVGGSSCGLTLLPYKISGLFYFGGFFISLAMGPLFSYYVELLGMAACLGVMVARISSVSGINIVGPFIISNCHATFIGITAVVLSGAFVSSLLPADRPAKDKDYSRS